MKLPKQLLQAILTAIETFTVYLILIIPIELLLTEKFLIIPAISNQTKTIMFGAIFLVVFLLNSFNAKFSATTKGVIPLIVIFFAVSLFVNYAYQGYYQSLQHQPKIYSISSPWGIQDMKIEITGKNFGPTWRKGTVWVDDVAFRILNWDDNKIKVETPVAPRQFQGKIYVVDSDGAKSNLLPFTIKDPIFLKN